MSEKKRERETARAIKNGALCVRLNMLIRKSWKRESGANETDRECQNTRKRECKEERREWKV